MILTRDEKIKRVIQLQKIAKEATEEMKILKIELLPEMADKQTEFGYNISKSDTCTYKPKEGVDVVKLAGEYPEYIKMDWAKLYGVIENVDEYIDKSISTGLTFKEQKPKKGEVVNKDLDF